MCKPKALSRAELDAMVKDIRSPKLLDWFIVKTTRSVVRLPASPGCTPPYAPVWIAEMVLRNEGAQTAKPRAERKAAKNAKKRA